MKLSTAVIHNLELSTEELQTLRGLLITCRANAYTDLKDEKFVDGIIAFADAAGV